MSNKKFNALRFVSEIVIPALVVFLGVVFANIPVEHSEAILAITGAVGVYLGALVNGYRKIYNGGSGEDE